MCHGQLVNEALLRARKAQQCPKCGEPIPVGAEYYSGTSLGELDGLLSRFKLCAGCAGLDAASERDEGMGCVFRDGADRSDPSVLERIATGIAKIRARLSKRRARTEQHATGGKGGERG